MANVANIIIICFLTYYTIYLIKLFNNKNRKVIINTNKKLDKLRIIPVKTLEEQKKFLDLKFQKSQKWKFSWVQVGLFILYGLTFFVLFKGYGIVFDYFNINVNAWTLIIFIILFPLFVNILLSRFDLENSDLTVFLGIRKKNKR